MGTMHRGIVAIVGAAAMAPAAAADFVGITWETVDNDGFADVTVDVFAQYDDPADTVSVCFGTPECLAYVYTWGGAFVQHPMGGDTPPSSALVDAVPEVAFDTFVTIGMTEQDEWSVNAPGFPGFGTDLMGGEQDLDGNGQDDGANLVWSVPSQCPFAAAGNDPDLRVRLARLSLNHMKSDIIGVYMDVQGPDGVECTFGAYWILFCCYADLNDDYVVDALDFLELIGQWGCEGDCTADFTGPGDEPDGVVDALDYLQLVAEWTPPGLQCCNLP